MKIHAWFVFIFVLFCAACGGSTQNGDDHLCNFPTQDAQAPDAGDAQGEPEAATEVDAQHEPEARVPTLTVKLNPKAKGSTVNINDKFIQMLWLDLEGDELEDVTASSLKLTRSGSGQDSSVELGLLDENYNLLWPLDGKLIKVDSQTHQASFSPGIKVPAQGKMSIVLIALFSGQPGEDYAFSLVQASDVAIDKGIVAGTFPIQGPPFSLEDGPNYFTQLIYDLPGAVPPGPFTGGDQSARLLAFEARSVFYTIRLMGFGFDLVALDGGKVRGSNGTFLIRQARMTNGSGSFLSDGKFMDPATTLPGAETMSFRFDLPSLADPILVNKGLNKIMTVEVEFAAVEDAPGEFFGRKYRLDLHLPASGTDAMLLTFADMLKPGAVEPKTSIQGPFFTIVAP